MAFTKLACVTAMLLALGVIGIHLQPATSARVPATANGVHDENVNLQLEEEQLGTDTNVSQSVPLTNLGCTNDNQCNPGGEADDVKGTVCHCKFNQHGAGHCVCV